MSTIFTKVLVSTPLAGDAWADWPGRAIPSRDWSCSAQGTLTEQGCLLDPDLVFVHFW